MDTKGQKPVVSPAKDSVGAGILELDNTNDVSVLRSQIKYFTEKCKAMETDKKRVHLSFAMEKESLSRQLTEAKAEVDVHKEELYRSIQAAMDIELNCCICNEVFIQVRLVHFTVTVSMDIPFRRCELNSSRDITLD
jgi:hypothetical protein